MRQIMTTGEHASIVKAPLGQHSWWRRLGAAPAQLAQARISTASAGMLYKCLQQDLTYCFPIQVGQRSDGASMPVLLLSACTCGPALNLSLPPLCPPNHPQGPAAEHAAVAWPLADAGQSVHVPARVQGVRLQPVPPSPRQCRQHHVPV